MPVEWRVVTPAAEPEWPEQSKRRIVVAAMPIAGVLVALLALLIRPLLDGRVYTAREAAYWARIGSREHLRWVLTEDEDAALDALVRLHLAGTLGLGSGIGRYVGAFRADGLLVPVWDLAPGTEAAALEEPARAFRDRLDEALANDRPLDAEGRRARAGLIGRQVTLR